VVAVAVAFEVKPRPQRASASMQSVSLPVMGYGMLLKESIDICDSYSVRVLNGTRPVVGSADAGEDEGEMALRQLEAARTSASIPWARRRSVALRSTISRSVARMWCRITSGYFRWFSVTPPFS
jgi:hypothetical protein